MIEETIMIVHPMVCLIVPVHMDTQSPEDRVSMASAASVTLTLIP